MAAPLTEPTTIELPPELIAVAFRAYVQPGCTCCDSVDNQAELTIASDVVRIYIKDTKDQSHKTVFVKIPAFVKLEVVPAPAT